MKIFSILYKVVKNPPANAGRHKRRGFDPWVGKIPLEEGMATHSSILAWRIHGQRSLAGYNPWSHTESDTTEATDALNGANPVMHLY